MSAVYKQWYQSRNKSGTVKSNVYHLKYIATREGVIYNDGCGFGMYGIIDGKEKFGRDINSLGETMKLIENVSESKTIYRAVVSLDEKTAIEKNILSKEDWLKVVRNSVNAIAKENNIEKKNFRYITSYHQEQGHPHCHIMFWDDSKEVREEYITPKAFEIGSEKIRASFNRTIYAEEILPIREQKDKTLKEIRSEIKEQAIKLFSPNEQKSPILYPKKFTTEEIEKIWQNIYNLNYSLSSHGQLKYAYLKPVEKQMLKEIANTLIDNSNLKERKVSYLKDIENIARLYGNSEETIQRQLDISANAFTKDVCNDVLKILTHSDVFLNRNIVEHSGLLETQFQDIQIKTNQVVDNFIQSDYGKSKLEQIALQFPKKLTPMNEVLMNENIRSELENTTKLVMTDEELKSDLIKQHFVKKNFLEHGGEIDKKINSVVYKIVWNKCYDFCQNYNHYQTQQQYGQLFKLFSSVCGLGNSNENAQQQKKKLKTKDLSKQAKKEIAKKLQDKSAWEQG